MATGCSPESVGQWGLKYAEGMPKGSIEFPEGYPIMISRTEIAKIYGFESCSYDMQSKNCLVINPNDRRVAVKILHNTGRVTQEDWKIKYEQQRFALERPNGFRIRRGSK